MAMLRVQVTAKDHAQGPENAQVTLVEYGDYECPHCGRAYPIVKRVQKHFGEKLRFIFRNFPLSETHPNAEFAAEVAEFAGENGKFWEMHDLLFENQTRLGGPLYLELAQKLGLVPGELLAALEHRQYKDRVHGDFSGGVRSGVNGTPTFFIGGKRHDAPFDFDELVAGIEDAMEGAGNAISA